MRKEIEMDTKLVFKISNIVLDKYDVIGHGPMPKRACQIGQWWVVPAQEYKGTIPTDIQQKMFDFLNSSEPFLGFLIAEDIKLIKEEIEVPQAPQVVETGLNVIGSIFRVLATGLTYLIGAILSFDPMLIAVLPDGRWICLGTWYE